MTKGAPAHAGALHFARVSLVKFKTRTIIKIHFTSLRITAKSEVRAATSPGISEV